MGDKNKTTYKVKAGDSWAKIAKMLYGDERMYAELQRGNSNILSLRPGQTIKLVNKVKNPFVSNTEAAAAGMMGGTAETGYGFTGANADILNATSQAVRDNNLQYNPSNRYGMYQLNKAAAGAYASGNYPGGAGAGGAAGGGANAPKSSLPAQGLAGPASSEAFYATQGMNTNAPAPGTTAPKPKAPVAPATAADYYAQQAQGTLPQQKPAKPINQGANTMQRGFSAPQSPFGQSQFTPGINAGAVNAQPVPAAGFYLPGGLSAAQREAARRSMLPTQYSTPAGPPAPGTQQPPAFTPPAPSNQPPQYTGAQTLANNTMNQLDAAMSGASAPPAAIHVSTINYMSFYGGMTKQQITDQMQRMGYMFDAGSNNWVQPNSTLPNYGVALPLNSPNAPAEFTGLPAIVPPRGYAPYTYVQRPGGGGQPAPEYIAPAPTVNYVTQGVTWNIGR